MQRVIKGNEQGTESSAGRPRSARTRQLVGQIKRLVSRNPERSIRKMGTDHKVSVTTMHRLVKVDLGLKSLKKTEAPLLTEQAKQRRLVRGQALLRILEDLGDNVAYSDEKKFVISQKHNRQNDRVLAASKKDIPAGLAEVPRQKQAASVMVWAGVSATWKSDLVFLDSKVNAAVYQRCVLSGPVLKAARGHFKNKQWIFTQDGAPAHTARTTRQWFLDNNVPYLANWPPSSPDLNPMDFSLWNALETAACSRPHLTVKSLKEALLKAWKELPQATIAKACRAVPKRIRQVEAANGEHID